MKCKKKFFTILESEDESAEVKGANTNGVSGKAAKQKAAVVEVESDEEGEEDGKFNSSTGSRKIKCFYLLHHNIERCTSMILSVLPTVVYRKR